MIDLENFLTENYQCYDRFTFDKIFRLLLINDFTNEEAKDIVLYNCSLSALIFQERIFNDYYKKINAHDKISKDLLELKNEIFNQKLFKYFNN